LPKGNGNEKSICVIRAIWSAKGKESRFCKQAKRERNMPRTRLEMVSSAFHSQAKRDRNASETRPKPERPPCEKHTGTLVQIILTLMGARTREQCVPGGY
jgi:hypothetical protein